MDEQTIQQNKEQMPAQCNVSIGHGCEFCSSGDEVCAKAREGCYKLHATDWLDGYPDNLPDDIVEVRFKNTHRSYYANVNNLPLQKGDIVAVEASPGHDIGIVSLTGDMVSRQMRRVGFNPMNGEFKKVYRKARGYDIEKWQEAIGREHQTMIRARQIAAEMNLDMKIGDVEFQGDGIKAIFYYIADERVDFRELIKVFAEQFRIRIEMKQIGARQEAGRIGGLGACGRQLCCASWISSFSSVTTNAARTQDLSLNPQKLAGQCSKLKCCLVYELDDYIDARKEFPRVNEPLQALDGDYFLVKSDILARTMSFSTQPGSLTGMVTLSINRVREIQRLNAEGKKPEKITSDTVYSAVEEEPGFVNAIGEESITRFDRNRRGRRRQRGGRNNSDTQRADQPAAESADNRSRSQGGGRPQQDGQNRQQQGNQNRRQNENRPQQGDRRQGDNRQGGRQNGGNPSGRDNRKHGGKPRNGRRPDNSSADKSGGENRSAEQRKTE